MDRFVDYDNLDVQVDQQALTDREIQLAASYGINYFAFDLYPMDEFIDAPNKTDLSQINRGYQHYQTSTSRYKSSVKWTLVVVNGGNIGIDYNSYAYASQTFDKIIAFFADPNWLYIKGRPVIFAFMTNMVADPGKTQWMSFLTKARAAGYEPYVIAADHKTTAFAATGCTGAVTAYGVNPDNPSASTHQSYQTLASRDYALTVPPGGGIEVCAPIRPLIDPRPQATTQNYGDQPTQPEWQLNLKTQANLIAVPVAHVVTAWEELFEEGPGIVPTNQEGTRYLDGLSWQQTGYTPTSYTYEISAGNVDGGAPIASLGRIVHTGSGWVTNFPSGGVTGAHNSDEEVSSTAADTISCSHGALLSMDIVGTTGPDRGKIDVSVDGGAATTVDLYRASATPHDVIWSSGSMVGQHTVTVTVRGDKNASSSSVQVGIDTFRPTYNPTALKALI